jgi:hypothetical protein
MNWRPFWKETAAKDGPQTLIEEIEKRGKQYIDDVDNGKFTHPPASELCRTRPATKPPSATIRGLRPSANC